MYISTIIPTTGRPSLERAIDSVLSQNFSAGDFEVVVVNDSGTPLSDSAWQRSPRVRVIDTQRRERCIARNVGAAIARGAYLHFLDDDDWLLPGALEAFWKITRKNKADWVYGASQLVNRQGNPQIELRPEVDGNVFIQVMAGEWIPPGASVIRQEAFFQVGGYQYDILYSEDVDLSRRIALQGEFVGISDLIACLVIGPGSTTDYANVGDRYLRGRDYVLSQAGVFQRLRASARSKFWHGRIVRLYLTSAIWNMRQKRYTTTLSRLIFGAVALFLSAPHALKKTYWQAIVRPYQSQAFARGFLDHRHKQI